MSQKEMFEFLGLDMEEIKRTIKMLRSRRSPCL